MSPTQVFHFPSVLRKAKHTDTPDHNRAGRESKVHHLLGIADTISVPTRKETASSATTTRLRSISVSDAATEPESVTLVSEDSGDYSGLQLKASSVLLREDYLKGKAPSVSNHSRRMRNYDSSSTLHSHYDAQKIPLAVSQQTSDSSTRDFALRKGAPVVVNPPDKDKEITRQMRFFKLSRATEKQDTKKLSKSKSPKSNAHLVVSDALHNSPSERSSALRVRPTKSTTVSKPRDKPRRNEDINSESVPTTRATTEPQSTRSRMQTTSDTAFAKVNVRRPKVGVKYWFDGLEGDTSEDESTHEPELQQTFVNGIETAFRDGRISATPKHDDSKQRQNQLHTLITKPSIRELSLPAHSSTSSKPHLIPSHTSTPAVCRSKVVADLGTTYRALSQPAKSLASSQSSRSSPLVNANLEAQSFLYLSSSEDDEEWQPPKHAQTIQPSGFIRDSVAAETIASDIEVGMAQAVSAVRASSQGTSQHRRPKTNTGYLKYANHRNVPSTRTSHMLSYCDGKPDSTAADHDVLTSFPATPSEAASSRQASVKSSTCLSDDASFFNTKLMAVTRQEQTLLAAMRQQKAAMMQIQPKLEHFQKLQNKQMVIGKQEPSAVPSNRASRIEALEPKLPPPSRTPRRAQHRHSLSGDEAYSRASCTTFQTYSANDPSTRLSRSTFYTDLSVDASGRRDSQLSALGLEHYGHSRTVIGSSHIVALDEFDKGQTRRHEIRSQEFIAWPYAGWEGTRAGAGSLD